MTDTDRTIASTRREGTYATFGMAAEPSATVTSENSRQRDFLKTGTENAATNVAEGPMFCLERKSKLKGVAFVESANITQDTSNYFHLKIYKRGGETATLLAQFNTHNSAQGSVTRWAQSECSINTTTDNQVVAAGSVITWELVKTGSGKALSALVPISFDWEEV